jgi:hypothetical protein
MRDANVMYHHPPHNFNPAHNKPELIGAALHWKRSGNGWLLCLERRRFGRVVPDAKHPGMFRCVLSGGRLSDMASLPWAKSAMLDAAVRELEWEAHHKSAIDPAKPQQNAGIFRRTRPLMRKKRRGPPRLPHSPSRAMRRLRYGP